MPLGRCRLCLRDEELRDSHLLAAGFYRLARTPADDNPNPVVATAGVTMKSSREVKSHALCGECEQRFSTRGEDWVLRNCLREREGFAIQDALVRSQPIHVDPKDNIAVFGGDATAGVDPDQLSYFAASVFWRAGAHTWMMAKSQRLKLSLGPYEESLRLFLRDEAPFPYGAGHLRPMYPDLLVFRKDGAKIKVDILDPHDDARADAAEKAVGLANFARKHGAAFGRIELIRVSGGQIQRLRLHQESVRDKVLRVTSLDHLSELYAQHG